MPEIIKEKKKCVEVNVFVKCDDEWERQEHRENENCCVEVNIYTRCEKEKKKERPCEEFFKA